MTEATPQEDERQEFLEHRASGIGATDSPKILGLSKYGTSLSVYHDKIGAEDKGMSLPAWLGLKMQSTVGELYTAREGIRLRAANQHYRHKRLDFMVCHLDFRAWGRPKLLVECKTRAYMAGWGEDGTTHIPADVWVQVQHEMAVMDAHECHVAVLFGHHTFNVYPIPRDDTFIAKLEEKLFEWWHRYYIPRVPPLPTGHDVDSARLKKDLAEHDATMVAATVDDEQLARRLKLAIVNEQQSALAAEEIRNALRLVIGENAGLVGSFGTITWKKSKDSESVDWEQVAVTYGHVIEDLLVQANPGDDTEAVRRLAHAQAVYETAVGLATTTKPGSRRFVATFKEGA